MMPSEHYGPGPHIGRIGLTEASRATWPFVLALTLVTAVLILYPPLTTIVPQLVFP